MSPHPPRRLGVAGLLCFALTACTTPPPTSKVEYPALDAPTPSPPGGLSLMERVEWWESRLYRLPEADRSEAAMRLGQLYLELQEHVDARRCFRQALEGPLSLVQQAQVEMGMGQSYLLADRRANAKKHLANAVKSLRGPEADECQLMLNLLDGNPLQADPIVLARVEQFLSPSLLALASHGPSAPGKLGVDVRRASWHAQPLRGNHDPMGNPKRITIHHSAEPFTSRTLGATLAEVRRIQGIHQDNQRWADIGYHFLIDPAGRIVEGRSIGIKGAHAGNAALNQGNLGICLLGNFAAQPNRGSAYAHAQSPTTVQLRALLDLVESMRAEYGIPRHKVESHGELKETECPGARLDSWVRSYRANP